VLHSNETKTFLRTKKNEWVNVRCETEYDASCNEPTIRSHAATEQVKRVWPCLKKASQWKFAEKIYEVIIMHMDVWPT